MAGDRRRKAVVSFEYGTRICAPSEGGPRDHVVAACSLLFDVHLDPRRGHPT